MAGEKKYTAEQGWRTLARNYSPEVMKPGVKRDIIKASGALNPFGNRATEHDAGIMRKSGIAKPILFVLQKIQNFKGVNVKLGWAKIISKDNRYTRISYSIEQDESCDGILEVDVVDRIMRVIK